MIEKILHLPIKEPWFSMTASGVKKEEYRCIKPFWSKILMSNPKRVYVLGLGWSTSASLHHQAHTFNLGEGDINKHWVRRALQDLIEEAKFYPFSATKLTNGYGRHRPSILVACNGITIGRGNPEWGAPVDRDVFIIHHGEIIHDYKRVGSYEEGDGSSEG